MAQALMAIDLLISPVHTIHPQTTIVTAHSLLLQHNYTDLFVVDEQHHLVGSITQRDLATAIHYRFGHALVQDFMGIDPLPVAPDTALLDVYALMIRHDRQSLPIVDHDRPIGIITRHAVTQNISASIASLDSNVAEIGQSLRSLLQQRLPPDLWQLLTHAANLATQQGWQLYLIGGAIRDLLLTNAKTPLLLQDIDLVVDATSPRPLAPQPHSPSDAHAPAMQLATALHQHYPEAQLQSHGQFQTAMLLWQNHPIVGSLCVDIATARTEIYPYPAANPQVTPSAIHQDLYRRDFTINALGVRLTGADELLLLDLFGGYRDLQANVVRVLHASSFIEDPTRIYRAARFAAKLGFHIEARTEAYIRYALMQFPTLFNPLFAGVPDRPQRTPALETRLKSELKYILQAPYWKTALRLLADLDALTCLHPSLKLDQALWRQLRLVDRYSKFGVRSSECGVRHSTPPNTQHPTPNTQHPTPPIWELFLETLIAHLADPYRGIVARNVQCPLDSIERLEQLEQRQTTIVRVLEQCDRPSQIVQQLMPYDTATLVLVGVRSSRPIRKLIWRYLSHWRHVKSPLDGNDLRALGYRPGKQFRQMLDDLVVAVLDGTIVAATTAEKRQQAEQFLNAHYPPLIP